MFGERYCSAVRTRSEPTSAVRLAGVTVGIFVTLALVVVGLTLMFLAMRSVMEIGGSCADGGPFQPVRPCPNGVGLAMFGGIWGGIVALGVYFWLATSYRVPSLLALAWPALFLSLGWNFMEYGFNSPAPGGGLEWGWIVCGVLFWAMGGLPLYLVAPMLFRSFWPSDPQGPVGLRDSVSVVRHPSLAGRSRAVTPRRTASKPVPPRVSSVSAALSSEEDTSDLTSRLERLAALHASGALTADEFALAKRKLLGETP